MDIQPKYLEWLSHWSVVVWMYLQGSCMLSIISIWQMELLVPFLRCSGLINPSCITKLYRLSLVHASIRPVLTHASTTSSVFMFEWVWRVVQCFGIGALGWFSVVLGLDGRICSKCRSKWKPGLTVSVHYTSAFFFTSSIGRREAVICQETEVPS